MKIIIAGAGAVGTHLAKLLSREKQDIILMDESEEKLSTLSSNFDLMTVAASPTSINGLKEVSVDEADLFIAVTPDESRNMTACMLANNLGAKKTVARIDNYEYLLPKNKEFFQKLGVDSLIYPEMLAAKEIAASVRMSWVRQWWEFCGGALILIGAKMREKAEILDIPLYKLGGPDLPYHVVAIKRGNETLIPRGDDAITLHDIVYFTTTRKYVPYIRKITGKEDYADVRNVMIMGGSRIAVRTAQYVPDYMQVKIVENDLNRCNRLTELLDDKTMIINGDGRDTHNLTYTNSVDTCKRKVERITNLGGINLVRLVYSPFIVGTGYRILISRISATTIQPFKIIRTIKKRMRLQCQNPISAGVTSTHVYNSFVRVWIRIKEVSS